MIERAWRPASTATRPLRWPGPRRWWRVLAVAGLTLGFREVVDAVDGIDVNVAQATANRGVEFLDRVQRQQNVVRALLAKAAASASLTDPAGAYGIADALSRSAKVDDTLTNAKLRELVMNFSGLRAENVAFVTAPVQSMGWRAGSR